MQFNRETNGKITKLPKPSVDTGMGLERISAVMQGVHNNYDIDLFTDLIKAIAKLANTKDLTHTSLRVIADHIRSSAFLITDGVTPSNEGRGYVLRRIIRRALRHGDKLGLKEPFFYKLVAPLNKEMGMAYPELTKAQSLIEKILLREEELFAATLEQGLKIFETEVASISNKIIPGKIVFRLYDTYGFPIDLTADIARERGLSIDEVGFHHEMEQQRMRSQAASKFAVAYDEHIHADHVSEFHGYETLAETAKILAITQDNQSKEKIHAGEEGILILEQTPFYAESGGQIGDEGEIVAGDAIFKVKDTIKQGSAILHQGKLLQGDLKVGDKVQAKVDPKRRQATALNHSATHLLNAALRKLLGDHVLQKGSLVEPQRLRFDFSHFESLTAKQISEIENLVNQQIRANHLVETKIMTPEEAMDSGAIALFGEKYGAEVRVLCMGDFSMELCGGTHVTRTGDIGIFKIISETGIASGIRRIEAMTGEYALHVIADKEAILREASEILKTNSEGVLEKLQQIFFNQRHTEKELERLQAKLASNLVADILQSAETIGDTKILIQQIEQSDGKALREILDQLKQKLVKAVILLAVVTDNRVNFIAGVTDNLTNQFQAGEIVRIAAETCGGKGGGRADMAQGAGSQVEKLSQALEKVQKFVQEKF